MNPTEILEVLDQRDGWYLVRPPAGSAPDWRTGWVSAVDVAPIPRSTVQTPAPAPPAPSPQPESVTAARKGFIIGLGGGAGRYTGSFPFGFSTGDGAAAVTDFRVGYAPTDQVLVFYSNQVAWMHTGFYDLGGLTGVGATYMFRPTSPSPFVTGAIGAGIGVVNLFGGSGVTATDRGSGYRVGGGYEFARRWSVEGGVMRLHLDSGNEQTALSATVNWLFY